MKKPVLMYTLLAYVITWSVVLTGYGLYQMRTLSLNGLNMAHSFGAIGPAVAAFITAQYCYGRKGIFVLSHGFKLKSPDPIILVIAFSPILLCMTGFFLYPLLDGKWYTLMDVKNAFKLYSTADWAGWLLPFLSYAIFEEIGWRGFLLPQLQEKYTAFRSTVYLTGIWALWHAPFFLYRFQMGAGMISGFVFGLFCGAIILTFLYNQSKGSVLVTMLFHLTNNIGSAFDKKYMVAALSTGFVLIAIYLLWRYGLKRLADRPLQTWAGGSEA